jgi:hypothetical protein
MNRLAVLLLTGTLAASPLAVADPIHAVGNGDYWHHDSGWVFPERVGEFVRIGFPQDVAGSRDAVGYYERILNGVKVVVDVDVFPSDSAAENISLESARAALVTAVDGTPGQLGDDALSLKRGLQATRLRFTPSVDAPAQALYFVVAGEWRVRIRVSVPTAAREVLNDVDAFVQSQKWENLAR